MRSFIAVILGLGCFFPGFFLSLFITIPLADKVLWPGDGQAVLGAMVISFWCAVAITVLSMVFFLVRAARYGATSASDEDPHKRDAQ